MTFFSIISAFYLQLILDQVLPQRNMPLLNIVSLGMVLIHLFSSSLTWLRSKLFVTLGRKLSCQIITEYVSHIIKLPVSFFDTRQNGDILSRFIDASKVIDLLTSSVLSIGQDMILIICSAVFLFKLNATLFLVSLIYIPLYLIVIISFAQKFKKTSENQMIASAKLDAHIIQVVNGINTIKALNMETSLIEKSSNLVKTFLITLQKQSTLNINQTFLKQLIEVLVNLLILWIGAYHIYLNNLTVGQLMTYNMLLVYLISPLKNIVNLQMTLQSAQVSSVRLNEILTLDHDVQKSEQDKLIANQAIHTLEVKQLQFAYNMKQVILRDVNFKMSKNSKTAIVGRSGSGKSTIAKLLTKFYEPIEGEIILNDVELKNLSSQMVRKHIQYVPQEPFFFEWLD